MSQILLEIRSNYNLKTIFSYVDYNRILNIIKVNKTLQKKLGLSLKNYDEKSSYIYIERKKIVGNNPLRMDNMETVIKHCFSSIVSLILFIYVLIYASILASKGAFNEKNTKAKFNKNYLKIIDKINLSLFGFLAYIIISYILIFVWGTINCYIEYGIKKIIKSISLITSGIIYLLYLALIICKLALSYKIKKGKITWFMTCDYILIVLIFLYCIFVSGIIYFYFKYVGNSVKVFREIILKKFRDIIINDFKLPTNFKEMQKQEKLKYILDNKNEYKITITNYQENLISSINRFRKEKNIDELRYNETIYFGDLIFIDKYSEPILYNFENIFKFSNGNYLFKYPKYEFEKKFINKEKNILDALSSDYLDKIVIIDKGNIEYIYLSGSDSNHINGFRNIDYIHRRMGSEICLNKKYRCHCFDEFEYYEYSD